MFADQRQCYEERPSCPACVKTGITCEYMDESDIIFRDQTLAVRRKAKKRDQQQGQSQEKFHRLESPSSSAQQEYRDIRPSREGASRLGKRQLQSKDHRQKTPLPRSSSNSDAHLSPPDSLQLALSEDPAYVALTVFFLRYCNQNRDPNGDSGMTNLLPHLYIKSEINSPFTLAVSAFALAIAGRWPERVDWKRLSVEKYSEAVTSLKGVLVDPLQLEKDEILAAIMQLIAYEKTNLPHVPGSGLKHMKGLLDLLKLRGVQNCTTDISQQLLSVARTHALTIHYSPNESLEQDEHLWIEAPGDNSSNVTTKLIKVAAKIRTLRKMIREASTVAQSREPEILEAINRIIATALKIDNELLRWPSAIPCNWEPLPAETIPTSVQSVGVFGGMCTIYCNIWAANAWNKYRLARVAIHTIILQHAQGLLESGNRSQLIVTSQYALRTETNGICSTVPFYLGSRDTSRTLDQPLIEFPSHSGLALTEETREHLITLGEWYLFWPLSRMLHNLDQVVRTYPFCINAEQMAWIQSQILRTGKRAATRSSLASSA